MKRIIVFSICSILILSFAFQVSGEEGKEKKFAVEVSIGAGLVNPDDIYKRTVGIEAMVNQYVDFTDADSTVTGEFKKVKIIIPMNLSMTYALNKKMYLRGGIEYGNGASSSEKGFLMSWPPASESSVGGTESQYYALNYKLTYLMPQVGVGYRVGNIFDIYGSVGLGFTRFNYTEDFAVLVNSSQTVSTTVDYKAKGTSPAVILGAKYRFPLRRWESESGAHGFIKLEYMLLNVKTLKGSKSSGAEDLTDATFYSFQWNPFGLGSFDYWEAFTSEPGGGDKTGIQKMRLNLSSIRLMIGISF
jgi:opacity protein-like surface antigen